MELAVGGMAGERPRLTGEGLCAATAGRVSLGERDRVGPGVGIGVAGNLAAAARTVTEAPAVCGDRRPGVEPLGREGGRLPGVGRSAPPGPIPYSVTIALPRRWRTPCNGRWRPLRVSTRRGARRGTLPQPIRRSSSEQRRHGVEGLSSAVWSVSCAQALHSSSFQSPSRTRVR